MTSAIRRNNATFVTVACSVSTRWVSTYCFLSVNPMGFYCFLIRFCTCRRAAARSFHCSLSRGAQQHRRRHLHLRVYSPGVLARHSRQVKPLDRNTHGYDPMSVTKITHPPNPSLTPQRPSHRKTSNDQQRMNQQSFRNQSVIDLTTLRTCSKSIRNQSLQNHFKTYLPQLDNHQTSNLTAF